MRILGLIVSMVFGVLVVLRDGQIRVFSESEALARVSEPEFAQALGHIPSLSPITYRQITQSRQGNTTVDAALERAKLGR